MLTAMPFNFQGEPLCVFCLLPRGVYNKKHNLGSQLYILAVVPTKFLVGGFRGENWFITSP